MPRSLFFSSFAVPPRPEAKEEKEQHKIEVGDLLLDIDRFEDKVRGEKVDLTVREFEVLKYLATQPRTNCFKRTIA